ncbi:hypothetical protein ABPG75_007333 [Micractinium tetrahymenae]
MDAARSAAGIRALPDPLLCAIFALAGRPEGPSLTLVSKHWRRCFFACPGLWSSLTLRPLPPSSPDAAAWLAGKRVLLRRVGPSLQELSLLCAEEPEEGADLSGGEGRAAAAAAGAPPAGSAAPPSAAAFQLAALLDSLQPQLLPQLRSLAVDFTQLPAGAAATLRPLGQLQGLALHSRGPAAIPAEVVQTAAQSLRHLTSLELSSFSARLPALPQLARLSALVELVLTEGQSDEGDEEEVPASPELEAWQAPPMQPPAPASFPALKLCQLSSRPSLMQVAGQYLHALELAVTPGGEAELFVSGLRSSDGSALATLLAAALPPSAGTSLTQCCLNNCWLAAGQLQGAGALAPLRALSVQSCKSQQLEEALAELLRQAPRLTELRVIECLGASVPACVQQRGGLRSLFLSWNRRLRALPPGPYLADLRELSLFGTGFRALPPAITAAGALTALSLANTELALTSQDIELLASRLPQLRRLNLRGFGPDSIRTPASVLHTLRARMPQLQVL